MKSLESLYVSYLYDKLNYVCIYMGSYSWSIAFCSYKRNRFYVLVGLYSDGSELKIIKDTCLCLVCPFLFLPCFGVICSLLPNRCTATWNLFVKMHFCNPADFSGCKVPKGAQWDIGNPHNKTCGCFWCSGVTQVADVVICLWAFWAFWAFSLWLLWRILDWLILAEEPYSLVLLG